MDFKKVPEPPSSTPNDETIEVSLLNGEPSPYNPVTSDISSSQAAEAASIEVQRPTTSRLSQELNDFDFQFPFNYPSSVGLGLGVHHYFGPALPSVKVRTPRKPQSVGIIKDSSFELSGLRSDSQNDGCIEQIQTLVEAAAADGRASSDLFISGLHDLDNPELYNPMFENSEFGLVFEGALKHGYPNNFALHRPPMPSQCGAPSLYETNTNGTLPMQMASSDPNIMDIPSKVVVLKYTPQAAREEIREEPNKQEVSSEPRAPVKKRRGRKPLANLNTNRVPIYEPSSPKNKPSVFPIDSGNTPRAQRGCWTCRLRRKKCDSQMPSCLICTRLGLKCWGYSHERPQCVQNHIKEESQTPRRPGRRRRNVFRTEK